MPELYQHTTYCDQLVGVTDDVNATVSDVTLVVAMKVVLGTVISSNVTAGLVSMKLIALASVTMRVHNSFGGTLSITPLEPLKVFEMFLDGQCNFAQKLLCTLPST